MNFRQLQPNPEKHLNILLKKLQLGDFFFFIRFSDGEIEILRNRFLRIGKGLTYFRGRVFSNELPDYDSKTFDPSKDNNLREDLICSAIFRHNNFIKGIQTSHLPNGLNDRNFLLRLNGGYDDNISFSDLFVNSNHKMFLSLIYPILEKFESIYVIANKNAKLNGPLANANLIPIPSNAFRSYELLVNRILNELVTIKPGTIVLSSASSLSNIIGHKLFLLRKDLFFIDVGTSLNQLLDLSITSRGYLKNYKRVMRLNLNRERKIKW